MVRRFRFGMAGAALLAGVSVHAVAMAQDAAPPLLIVPGLSQGQQQPALRPAVQSRPQFQIPTTLPATLAEDRAPSGISIGSLADVSPEAVGLLPRDPSKPWQRDLGASLWYGATQDDVLRQVVVLPGASSSPAVRDLVRQILLTAAVPSLRSEQAPAPGALTAARMDKLLEAGLADDALRLAKILPQDVVTESVSLARMRALWMTGDIKSACAEVEAGAVQYATPIWIKMRTACAAIEGNLDKAQLSLALLDELQAIDEGFSPIADRILGKNLSLAELPKTMDMAEVAAFVAMGGKLPEDLPLLDKPWLVRFAIPATGPISDGHLAVMEFGLRRGILTRADAEAIYDRVKLSQAEIKDADNLTAVGDTPRQRLAYYRAFLKAAPKAESTSSESAGQTSPQSAQVSAVQVEIIAKLLQAARLDPQDQAVLAVLLRDHLAQMAQSPLAAWLADDALRLALWSGDWETARSWMALAKQNSGASKDARRAIESLTPLMALADAAQTVEMRGAAPLPPMVTTWAAAQQARGLKPDQIAQMRDRLFGLYRVFSMAVDPQDWRTAATANVQPYPVLTASPVAVAAARDAAVLGARGLALSGVAHQMGDLVRAGGASASPIAVEQLVGVLLQAGAVDWAKRIAVESMLAAGA